MTAIRPFTDARGGRVPVTVDVDRARAELDIDRRRAKLPPDACMRGVWFRLITDAVAHAGPGTVAAFQRLAVAKSRWFFKLYPVADYYEEIAIAAALLYPDDAREGVRTLWRETSKYSGLMHPNTFISLLKPDPIEPLRWLAKNRDSFANFGRFRLEEKGPGEAVMHLEDDYIWIDSAQRGGSEGMLEACGVVGEVTAELDDDFNGRLYMRWQPRK